MRVSVHGTNSSCGLHSDGLGDELRVTGLYTVGVCALLGCMGLLGTSGPFWRARMRPQV